MKKVCLILFFTFNIFSVMLIKADLPTRAEMDSMFSGIWSKPEYQVAHAAQSEDYLTEDEKNVFYYLNLARISPKLFVETYLKAYQGKRGMKKGFAFDERKESLIKEMMTMDSLPPVYPNKTIYSHAQCFAINAGKKGIENHDREGTGCQKKFSECCAFSEDALYIVLDLLIDWGRGNEKLGHRKACFGEFDMMGVSIQPHQTGRYIAVLNFGFNPTRIHCFPGYTGFVTEDGKRQGRGIYKFPNGDKYEGYWKNNQSEGYGVYFFANGDKYEGEFKNGKMNGTGIYFFASGTKMPGLFADGKLEKQLPNDTPIPDKSFTMY